MESIDLVLDRLQRIESTFAVLIEKHSVKEWYMTHEIAQILGKAEFTVREKCQQRRINSEIGSGKQNENGTWQIANIADKIINDQ